MARTLHYILVLSLVYSLAGGRAPAGELENQADRFAAKSLKLFGAEKAAFLALVASRAEPEEFFSWVVKLHKDGTAYLSASYASSFAVDTAMRIMAEPSAGRQAWYDAEVVALKKIAIRRTPAAEQDRFTPRTKSDDGYSIWKELGCVGALMVLAPGAIVGGGLLWMAHNHQGGEVRGVVEYSRNPPTTEPELSYYKYAVKSERELGLWMSHDAAMEWAAKTAKRKDRDPYFEKHQKATAFALAPFEKGGMWKSTIGAERFVDRVANHPKGLEYLQLFQKFFQLAQAPKDKGGMNFNPYDAEWYAEKKAGEKFPAP